MLPTLAAQHSREFMTASKASDRYRLICQRLVGLDSLHGDVHLRLVDRRV